MENNDFKIGLWGGSQSGKTTYLAALNISIYQINRKKTWTIHGDDPSMAWLLDISTKLMEKGIFSSATNSVDAFSFTLESLPDERGKPVRINIASKDVPGGYYKNESDFDETITDLANCNGIILFLKGDATNWGLINKGAGAIKYRSGAQDRKIAVCLSQYDDPEIFSNLRKNKLIETKQYKGRETPIVTNPRKAIEKCVDNGNNIINLLEAHFKSVEYFAISSVGFYNHPDNGRLDLDHCSNIAVTPEGKKIRSGINILPVNVWAPIAWIAGAKVK